MGVVAGTVAGIPIAHSGGRPLHALKHHVVVNAVVAVRWTSVGAFERLPASGLVFVIGIVLLVLHSQSLCFVNERPLLFFRKKSAGQKTFEMIICIYILRTFTFLV